MSTPEISVVVPCHNSTGTLGLQLEALHRQEHAPEAEILLCDNGSEDGLEAWLAARAEQFPRARYVDASARKGAAYARNRGIGRARAEKLAFCDDDDVVGPGWLAAAARLLEEYPIVSGGVVTLERAEFPDDVDAVWALIAARHEVLPPVPAERASLSPVLMGCTFAARRDYLAGLGGFDAALDTRGEDNELAYRIEESGTVLHSAEELVIAYRNKDIASGNLLRVNFEDGLSLARVCAAHDAWDRSSTFRIHPAADLLRTLGSAGLMALGRKERNWRGIVTRTANVAGNLAGVTAYRHLHRRPEQAVGEGIA